MTAGIQARTGSVSCLPKLAAVSLRFPASLHTSLRPPALNLAHPRPAPLSRANDIGFLRRQNRVNVLLSRAKHGMFLVGNPACLTGGRNGDSMWARILPDLEAQGLVGPSLPLCCQKHPETCTPVASGRDFDDLVAEGGCQRNCGERMGCGHACPRCAARALGWRVAACSRDRMALGVQALNRVLITVALITF